MSTIRVKSGGKATAAETFSPVQAEAEPGSSLSEGAALVSNSRTPIWCGPICSNAVSSNSAVSIRCVSYSPSETGTECLQLVVAPRHTRLKQDSCEKGNQAGIGSDSLGEIFA